MNILICDDIKAESEKLVEILKNSNHNLSLTVFESAKNCLEYSNINNFDVCFLDILMPDMNGIELAEKLRGQGYTGEIVFLTSSNDFGHQSYRVKAFDYLLKPLNQKDILQVVSALENALESKDRECLYIRTMYVTRAIKFRDISHIEVINHSVFIRLLNNTEIEVYTTLADISQRLSNDPRFIRCHRSFIINMADIKSVSDKEITMQTGKRIPISRSFSDVKDKMIMWIFGGKYD